MAGINRTQMPTSNNLNARAQALDPELVEALNKGNIFEVIASHSDFKIEDFQQFFASQWREWAGSIVQDNPIKSNSASVPAPNISDFPMHHKNAGLGEQDIASIGESLNLSLNSMASKALNVGSENALPQGDTPMGIAELESMADGTMDEWQEFMNDTWNSVFDMQMMREYQSKMGEVESELKRLIALAKDGRIGVEFVLIAMAKVNSTKNGVLMSWLGKKTTHINESLQRVSEDLHTLDPSDPRYYGEMQLAQSETRDKSYQLNLLMADMQKLMQNISSVMDQVHGMLGEINRTKREIISKYSAR